MGREEEQEFRKTLLTGALGVEELKLHFPCELAKGIDPNHRAIVWEIVTELLYDKRDDGSLSPDVTYSHRVLHAECECGHFTYYDRDDDDDVWP